MVSKPSMASDTNIKKPKAVKAAKPARSSRVRSIAFSSLARAIFISNMVGLLILVVGALTLNEVRRGLIDAKLQNLYSQAELITNILASDATGDGVIPTLDVQAARATMRRVALPDGTRVRLFGPDASLIADSAMADTVIDVEPLDPPAAPEEAGPYEATPQGAPVVEPQPAPRYRPPPESGYPAPPAPKKAESRAALSVSERVEGAIARAVRAIPSFKKRRDRLRRNLDRDIRRALLGDPVVGEQYNDDESLIVSVSLPVQRVQAVLGVVTMESSDVERILAGERRALGPIALLAFFMTLLTSLALTLFIALPIRRLAKAAEIVQRSSENRDAIPDLSGRRDEIGDLSVVLRSMTAGLYDRIDDIANFAADVAHEIKNPLTSLRSATETFQHAKTEEQREKLLGIIQNDVGRMDRLITDISRASRMDAELARAEGEPIELEKLLTDMADFYSQTRSPGSPAVRYVASDEPSGTALIVRGSGEKLGQVVRNLIDNALTFSPEGGEVRLRVRQGHGDNAHLAVLTVDDDGKGIPPANLESIFDRFYTERPKGTAFGSHSGLGLAICRQIIRAHKGSIRAENRKAAGSDTVTGAKFTVEIPLWDQD